MTHDGELAGRSMKIACVCVPRTGTCNSSPEYAGEAVMTMHANAQTATANRRNSFQNLSTKQVAGFACFDF
ncbi:hypothetical protein [Paraburkholderia sp. BL23I1N1]|uniref:hypothetical protein n=1 Tax=Paraburkholderia sp. BL23I1N1 TaxID=1938802 RepID=UPI0011C42762|nr:hypothetical protein [Paraburkholderia sp. BL23I1N1]